MLTIEQFIEEELKRIQSFKDWYLREHKTNPEHFPMKMDPGDWDEQLNMFDPSWTE